MSVFSQGTSAAIEREEARLQWFGLSLLIHLLLFLLLAHFAPLQRAWQKRADSEPMPLPAHMIEALARRVEEAQLREMEKMVEEIEALETELTRERELRVALLSEQLQPFDPSASDRALEAMRRALRTQDELLAMLGRLPANAEAEASVAEVEQRMDMVDAAQREALAELSARQVPDPSVQAQLEAVARQQHARAIAGQARQALERAQGLAREAEQARQEAARLKDREWPRVRGDVQRRALEHQRAIEARSAREQAVREKDAAAAGAEHAHRAARERLDAVEKRLAEAQAISEDLARQSAQSPGDEPLRRRAAEASRQVETVRRESDAAQREVQRAADLVARAQQAAERARQELQKAQEAETRASTERERAEVRFQALEQRIAELDRRAALLSEAQRPLLEQALSALKNSMVAHQTARTAQRRAIEALQAASQDEMNGRPAGKTIEKTIGESGRIAAVSQVYERARESEARGAFHYREIRAMNLAMTADVPLSEARRRVDVPMPMRPPAAEILATRAPVRTRAEFERMKRELVEARRTLESMAAATRARLEAVRAGRTEQILGEALREMIERDRALNRLAHEGMGGHRVDLTSVMAVRSPADVRGASVDTPAGETSTTQAPAGNGTSLEDPASEAPRVAAPPEPRPPPEIRMQEIRTVGLGRRVTHSGPTNVWLAVNSWYIVGPFPNPKRENIHREFPPESGQGKVAPDLDAVYVGAEGRPVRWEYVQSPGPLVAPKTQAEYTIWYAYTEVYFDEPREAWVALGSDDRSDVWLNGMKIWASSDRLKAWNIGEGYRKVRFEKGINRILYRIENGHGGLGFSFVIHLGGS